MTGSRNGSVAVDDARRDEDQEFRAVVGFGRIAEQVTQNGNRPPEGNAAHRLRGIARINAADDRRFPVWRGTGIRMF